MPMETLQTHRMAGGHFYTPDAAPGKFRPADKRTIVRGNSDRTRGKPLTAVSTSIHRLTANPLARHRAHSRGHEMNSKKVNRVAIVGGARTPFAKMGTALKEYSSLALGTHSVDGALEKLDLDPAVVDQLVYGVVIVDPVIPHLAREINFRSRLPSTVQALTLTDNCISGTSAIASIHDAIAAAGAASASP